MVPLIPAAPGAGTTLVGPVLMSAVGAVTPCPVHAATLRASSATTSCFHRFTTHLSRLTRNALALQTHSESTKQTSGTSRGSNITEHSTGSLRELPGISQAFSRGPFVRIRFGPFTLDFDTRQLTRTGREIHLEPKAFDLLAALVLDRPKVLSKAALQERLWPATFVAEANLSNLVAELREALGDAARRPVYIRTAHGFGYAFCADAAVAEARERAPDDPSCWLEWDGRRLPLSIGTHVIGRDPDVEIRLDQSTVSRRHARLVVTTEGAVLEAFVSKNGTFRGMERVSAPIQLADGDAIRVGSVLMTFRLRAFFGSAETQLL